MSVFDELDKIPVQKLASDMGDKFTAKVVAVTTSVKTGQYAGTKSLKVELLAEDGSTFTTTYRIPKAHTGKGQLDMLISHLDKLHLGLKDMQGKTFMWQQIELPGSVTGNARHYPVKLVK